MPSSPSFPACFVELPASARGKRAAFYLATEEYIASRLPEDSYLFTWRVGPTVVMGRNQEAHNEINLDFCRREGIDVTRRKSGGGCIFADSGNIMVSLVTGRGSVEPLFAEYAKRVADGLCRLGADAEVSGRNDIVLAGKGKICGNAFYHLPHRNIVHGTMLYDTTPYYMSGALTPEVQKLHMTGVKSVRSRIGLLRDVLDLNIDELELSLRHMLTNRSVLLSEEDLYHISSIEADYYDPAFLWGHHRKRGVTRSERIAGCGRVTIGLELRDGVIAEVTLRGDFFEEEDAAAAFRRALTGIPLQPDALTDAVNRYHPERTIRGLSTDALITLLCAD